MRRSFNKILSPNISIRPVVSNEHFINTVLFNIAEHGCTINTKTMEETVENLINYLFITVNSLTLEMKDQQHIKRNKISLA